MNRFKSKRFLLAVSAAIAFVAVKQYPEAIAVVLGYFGVETVRPSK